jgi:hypothetical protein
MNTDHREPGGTGSGSPPGPRRALWLAVALSAVPLLALAPKEFIGFDAFWHVFVARQDTWHAFWDEVHRNAHPPLFYLLLKGAITAFGSSLPAYRAVSVAATLGSAWLVGRIVEETSGRPWLPAIAAFAFGTSLTTVTIGLDVRAYALGTFFMLWATLAFLDLVRRSFGAPGHAARVTFALAASLALLTHYVAALFLAGCCVTAALLAVVDRDYRRGLLANGARHRLANLLTFGAPLAVLAVEYGLHAGSWSGRIHHVSSFFFDPGREGAFEFAWRNTREVFRLFAPALHHRPYASTLIVAKPPLAGWAIDLLVVSFAAAIAWLACAPPRNREAVRRAPPLLLLAMVGLLVAAALLGRYPYGGWPRHQYFLFPFVVVALSLLIDRVAPRTGRAAGLAVGLFGLAVLVNTTSWVSQFRITEGYLMQTPINRFRELFPSLEIVYVDQFTLIHVFTHYQGRPWRLHNTSEEPSIDVWRVGGSGPRGFYVCRDRRQWLLDFSRRLSYRNLRGCLDATGARQAAVLRIQQPRRTANWPVERTEELAAGEAERYGLRLGTVVVEGADLYASFALL